MWTGLGDFHYEFQGALKAGAITGDVQSIDARSGDGE